MSDCVEASLHLFGHDEWHGNRQTIFVDAGAHLEAYPRDFVHLGK